MYNYANRNNVQITLRIRSYRPLKKLLQFGSRCAKCRKRLHKKIFILLFPVWSWKLSRTKSLSTTAVANINAIINNIEVLNNRYYETIDNSDEGCFYFPTPGLNTPVIFRGQCDQSINTVMNFDAVRVSIF